MHLGGAPYACVCVNMYGWLLRGGQKRNQAVLVWLIGLWNEMREIKGFCFTSVSSYCVFLPTYRQGRTKRKSETESGLCDAERKYRKWIISLYNQWEGEVRRSSCLGLDQEKKKPSSVWDLTFQHHLVMSIMWTCLWVKSIAQLPGSLCITEVIHISNPHLMNVF